MTALLATIAIAAALGAPSVSATEPTAQLFAIGLYDGTQGLWLSGGTGPIFRAFLIQGADPLGPIHGQQNVCGESFAHFPALTLTPGTYDFTILGTGLQLAPGEGSAALLFGDPEITVTQAAPNGAPTQFGNTIVTVSNFTMGSTPAMNRVSVCSATPDGAQDTIAHFTVTVEAATTYSFGGFLAPVEARPTLNLLKAGAAVPVKFSLGGDQGLDIFAAEYPKSQTIACDSTADVEAIDQTVAAGGSSLAYDAATDIYTYVWKTDKAWAGTCRQLVLTFADAAGTVARANFKFK